MDLQYTSTCGEKKQSKDLAMNKLSAFHYPDVSIFIGYIYIKVRVLTTMLNTSLALIVFIVLSMFSARKVIIQLKLFFIIKTSQNPAKKCDISPWATLQKCSLWNTSTCLQSELDYCNPSACVPLQNQMWHILNPS